MLTRQDIEVEARRFFEWPGTDKSVVTTVSAILFAEHCARLATAPAHGLRTNQKPESGTPMRPVEREVRPCEYHQLNNMQ